MTEQEMKFSTLAGNDVGSLPLMRKLFSLSREILVETTPNEPTARRAGKMLRPLRPDEEYTRSSLLCAGEILNVCDQMAYAVEFLSGFRSRKLASGEPITRLDHIVYHLENHLIRTSSVLERALQLVNIIFRLGTPEQECRFSVISRNDYVSSSPTAEGLRAIQKIVEPYQGKRNIVIHRRGLSDDKLGPLEIYYVFQKSEGADDEITQNYFHFFKTMTDNFVKMKKQELTEFNTQAFSAVSDLLLSLEPIFEANHTALRDNPGNSRPAISITYAGAHNRAPLIT